MLRLLAIVGLLVFARTAEAQGNLSELFSIVRSEGPRPSAEGQKRIGEIALAYASRQKDIANEWQAIDAALTDTASPVREQACAVLAMIMYVNQQQPVRLPEATRNSVVQRFNDASPNLRENAIRIIALMEGGVPATLGPQLLVLARNDPAPGVQRLAIYALSSIRNPGPEINEYWIQSLTDAANKDLRGMVLNAFRVNAPSDQRIIPLVIDALKDSDRFVRQEAIASVIRIGKPAESAIPLLIDIRNAPSSDESMRANAEAAIRILTLGK